MGSLFQRGVHAEGTANMYTFWTATADDSCVAGQCIDISQ